MQRGRIEDERFVTGRGRFVEDLSFPGELVAVFLRSTVAHGRLRSVDLAPALATEGVVAAYSAADLDADGLPEQVPLAAFKRPDGSPTPEMRRPFLARDVVRHLGEPIAMVIAETREAALAGAEAIGIEMDDLPAIVDAIDAIAAGAAPVRPELPDNIAFEWEAGDHDAVEAALATAAHRVRLEYGVSRVFAAPLEPRRAIGLMGPDCRPTLHASMQNPFQLRDRLAANVLGIDTAGIRVVAPDVGGSFGLKSGLSREDALVVWAARRLGRPVRWIADRSEAFLGDEHARDVGIDGEIGLDRAGRFLALRIRYLVNLGSFVSARSMAPINNIGGIAGTYGFPCISATITGVLTHTEPTAAYRGAGRPEATYALERLIDKAASTIGVDPFELRWRNLIGPEAMPYKTALTLAYDSGDFPGNMKMAAEAADLTGFALRRAEAESRGKLLGLGIANPIEVAGGPRTAAKRDLAAISVDADGRVEVRVGSMSVGQGLETSVTRLVATRLGVPETSIVYRQGDSDTLRTGRGSGGSSATVLGGPAVLNAVDGLVASGRAAAAAHLGIPADDVLFEDGHFRGRNTNFSASVAEMASLVARSGTSWRADGAFEASDVTYPNGCHICEVEIDPETGDMRFVRYVAVEDVGRLLNPQMAHGQLMGGIAQGLGQVLGERIVYDKASGQLLTGSFMDYLMPRATDLPEVRIVVREIPTSVNPLGAKGIGEAGTVGALAAGMNAVCDALRPLGIEHLDMPASPDRIWTAIDRARRARNAA